MAAKLIEPGVKGARAREFLIQRDEFLLGRGTDCDVRLNDINVSRHHCLIRFRPEEVTLTDLGSSNGTYVNGHRVLSQVALHTGDEIRLGEFRFLLDLGEGARPDSDADIDPLARTLRLGDVDKRKDE
jgi:pSer/pThr/pTyr-binding forkhead associated (FHA) protein